MVKELNISFTKLGEEECERFVQFKIHVKPFGHERVIQTYKDWTERSNDEMETQFMTNSQNQVTDCPECMDWIKHKKAASSARRHYNEDSGKNWPDDCSIQSADLQKVLMLPRLPGNKTAVFTKRLVAYH